MTSCSYGFQIHNLGKLFKKKPAEKPVEVEDGGSKETGSTPAASLTPDPVHNAMGEQRPATVASAQFYKASMYHTGVYRITHLSHTSIRSTHGSARRFSATDRYLNKKKMLYIWIEIFYWHSLKGK